MTKDDSTTDSGTLGLTKLNKAGSKSTSVKKSDNNDHAKFF